MPGCSKFYLIVGRFACKQFSALHSVAADVFSEGLLWQCVFTFVRLESATRPTCVSLGVLGVERDEASIVVCLGSGRPMPFLEKDGEGMSDHGES